MPKRPDRADGSALIAERFRERVAQEQQRQGISDAGLARRATDLGVGMTAATIWKIKAGNPPRKVDLDEAHAIANALDFRTVEQMLNSADLAQVRAARSAAAGVRSVSYAANRCRRLIVEFEKQTAAAAAEQQAAAAALDGAAAGDSRRFLIGRIDAAFDAAAITGEQLRSRLRGEITDAELLRFGGQQLGVGVGALIPTAGQVDR